MCGSTSHGRRMLEHRQQYAGLGLASTERAADKRATCLPSWVPPNAACACSHTCPPQGLCHTHALFLTPAALSQLIPACICKLSGPHPAPTWYSASSLRSASSSASFSSMVDIWGCMNMAQE